MFYLEAFRFAFTSLLLKLSRLHLHYCSLTSASNTFDCNDIGDCYLQSLRPEIPRCCPSSLASIMRKCWDAHPERRPDMDEVVRLLEAVDTSKGGGMIPDDQARGCFCFTAHGP